VGSPQADDPSELIFLLSCINRSKLTVPAGPRSGALRQNILG